MCAGRAGLMEPDATPSFTSICLMIEASAKVENEALQSGG